MEIIPVIKKGANFQMIESWQIFAAAKKALPAGTLQNIYSRSRRLVDAWAANPAFCEVHERNPLDRIRIMIRELDASGYGIYARHAVDYLAQIIGGHFEENSEAKSDKGSVEGEAADILTAAGTLVAVVRESLEDGDLSQEERWMILEHARNARRQIDELLDAAGVANE